jgi:DNA repair protein RadC
MTLLMAAVPPHDRPRERLLARGAEALTERELLALLLRHGTPGASALDLADALTLRFGTLKGLALARPEELEGTKGLGAAKAAALAAAFELGRRVACSGAPGPTMREPEDLVAVASAELSGARRERVLVIVCDAGNRLRRTVVLTEGSIDRSLAPVREILNCVLRADGRSFALAHNHPSGDPSPSEADRRVTADVRAAARVVGLRFLGHIVVADDGWRAVV